MQGQDQSLSKQAQPSAQQAPAAMQVLNAEELRAVAGGPEIQNGGANTG
jgi:hypothetical protein